MNATPLKTASVSEILANAQQVEIDKKYAIESLLKEADDLDSSTLRRQAEIKTQLKALGYKVTRTRKEKA